MKLAEKFGAELLQDILKAYAKAGGVEVFMRDERLLEQALLQLMTPVAEPVRVVIDFAEAVPWLDMSQRLSYKNSHLHLVEDAKQVEQSTSSNAPSTLLLGLDKPIDP